MKQLLKITPVLLALILSGCIGTDLIDDPIISEKLTILPRIDSLALGQEQVFSVIYTNQYGVEEPVNNIVWSSSNPEKIVIDAAGKAVVLLPGKATLYATDGSLADSIVLNRLNGIDPTNNPDTSFFKQGVFKPGSGSYFAKGRVYVQTIDGLSQILTGTDFDSSPGPSVYLLLANHTNGNYAVTPGSHVINSVSAQITANKLTTYSGKQTWAIPPGVNPANYKYVVLYCVLGPVFGTAELN